MTKLSIIQFLCSHGNKRALTSDRKGYYCDRCINCSKIIYTEIKILKLNVNAA